MYYRYVYCSNYIEQQFSARFFWLPKLVLESDTIFLLFEFDSQLDLKNDYQVAIKFVNKLPGSVLQIPLVVCIPITIPDDAIYQENLILGSIVTCTGT